MLSVQDRLAVEQGLCRVLMTALSCAVVQAARGVGGRHDTTRYGAIRLGRAAGRLGVRALV